MWLPKLLRDASGLEGFALSLTGGYNGGLLVLAAALVVQALLVLALKYRPARPPPCRRPQSLTRFVRESIAGARLGGPGVRMALADVMTMPPQVRARHQRQNRIPARATKAFSHAKV